MYFNKKKYKSYLLSDEWKIIANECKRLADYKCRKCGSSENLNTHHKTYENIFNESQDDLECLCKSCHKKEHDHTFGNGIKGGFVLMYPADYDEVIASVVNSNKEARALLWIKNSFTYQKVEVPITYTYAKKENVDIGKRQFSQLLKKLVDMKFLVRVSRGMYRMNPFVYIPYRANAEELQSEWNDIINNHH